MPRGAVRGLGLLQNAKMYAICITSKRTVCESKSVFFKEMVLQGRGKLRLA